MINIEDIPEFKSSISELKKTSYDNSNKQYMTESTLNVCDFDNVAKDYCDNIKTKHCTSSVDAFYIDKNNEMYLIEFKNGKVKPSEIKKKIYETLLVMADILKTHISDTRESLNFILVSSKIKSSKKIREHVGDKATTNESEFDILKFKNIFFKEVFTLNQEEFENDFVKKWEA